MRATADVSETGSPHCGQYPASGDGRAAPQCGHVSAAATVGSGAGATAATGADVAGDGAIWIGVTG